MDQRQAARPDGFADEGRILPRAVPPPCLHRELGGGVLGIVDEQLDAVRQAVDDDIQLGIRCDLNGAPKICINGRVVREPDPSKELLERIFKG